MIHLLSRPRLHPLPAKCVTVLVALIFILLAAVPIRAADRDRIEAFLNVTGFDVALDSIAFAASSAPQMLGIDARDFGSEWHRLTDEVFDTEIMHGMAVEILENTLTDELLTHAAGFYATDLGQRLVVAENEAHMMEDDSLKQAEGQRIVADLVAEGASRLEMIKRMNAAIDTSGSSVRALQEIQVRFLLAASAAGVVDLRMDPDELRAFLRAQEPEMLSQIRMSSLAGAAFTYRDFSDADVEAYTLALEHPDMRDVYTLLNAVQFEVMANRFEALAARMSGLQPGQDI